MDTPSKDILLSYKFLSSKIEKGVLGLLSTATDIQTLVKCFDYISPFLYLLTLVGSK
jgi:hypothetical protein